MATESAQPSIWTLLLTSVLPMILGGMGWIIITGLQKDLSERKEDVDKINRDMAPLLTLYAQHKSDEDRFNSFQTQIDGKLNTGIFTVSDKATADRITALELSDASASVEALHQLHSLEEKIVSREENVVHWAATDALTLRVNSLADKMCK